MSSIASRSRFFLGSFKAWKANLARSSARASSSGNNFLSAASPDVLFYLFGLGTEYADALLELPPEHPAWADLHSLLDIAWEASDPAAVEAYVHALAEHQPDTGFLRAESLYLQLREADRARDWDRAAELTVAIAAIRVGPPENRQPIAGRVNIPIAEHDPTRMQARAYRAEYGIEDWPVLLPRLDGFVFENLEELARRPRENRPTLGEFGGF
jgi:hypothetical protein